MKSILEKFYSVKKYGVAVFLAAASCFSFAMDCDVGKPFQSGGKWYVTVSCYGTVGGSYDVEVEYGGGSGGEGGSTNCGCTAMSTDQCEALKASVYSSCDSADSLIQDALDAVSFGLSELETAQEKINDVISFSSAFESIGSVNDAAYEQQLVNILNTPQSPFIETTGYISDTPYADLIALGSGANSIKSYSDSFVNPALEDVSSSLVNTLDGFYIVQASVGLVSDEIASIRSYVDTMDCSPCVSSGGGGDSPSSPSSGCPCKEVLEAIKQILNEHKQNVQKIKERLDSWDKYLKQMASSVNALAYMGTNFTYAVKYKTLDGVSFTMKQLDDKFLSKKSATFDYQEFGNLSWYSRIEYLLMSIAGVFSKTNREDELTISKLDSAYSDIAYKQDTLQNQVISLETKFGSLHSAISGLMSAFSGAIGSGSSSGAVTLMASWFGGRGLVMTIPDSVISTSRTVFSLLWTVIFTFTMYQIVLNGWVFIVKFVQFWITQTTGFLK